MTQGSVNLGVFAPTVVEFEEKTQLMCETFLDRSLEGEHWTRAKLPTALGPRSADEPLKVIAFGVTEKKTETR